MKTGLIRPSRTFGSILLFLVFFGFSSCVGTGTNIVIPGVKGPNLNLTNTHVLITAVFENLNLGVGLRYKIPGSKDSYVELSPDLQSSGTLLSVGLSIQDVFGGEVEDLRPMGLPGGRALPEIPGGRMPGTKFSIKNFTNMVFYLDERKYGLFFPMDITIFMPTGFDFHVGSKVVGRMHIISPDLSDSNSGFLLMLNRDINVIKKFQKRLRRKGIL